MQEVSNSLDGWATLPMSLMGKINTLKINVLPKLLYSFQNLALPLANDLFSQLKTIFIKFLWNNHCCTCPMIQGGLNAWTQYGSAGLHNWELWCFRIQRRMRHYGERWKVISWSCLCQLTYMQVILRNSERTPKNPMTRDVISAWHQVRKYLKEADFFH